MAEVRSKSEYEEGHAYGTKCSNYCMGAFLARSATMLFINSDGYFKRELSYGRAAGQENSRSMNREKAIFRSIPITYSYYLVEPREPMEEEELSDRIVEISGVTSKSYTR